MQANSESGKALTLFPDDVKEYTRKSKEGTYTLLDVRQPFEYEENHLPGARLIPLPQLADSLGELDPRRPTIVYCAVGGRSRMAAQMLVHRGFDEVYHLEGGIEAWEDPTATGPREFHLKFIRGDESPEEAIMVAYRMEEGLKRFHELMKAEAEDPDLVVLLTGLIKAEESHERTLLELLSEFGHEDVSLGAGPVGDNPEVMEGGIDASEFVNGNRRFLHSVSGYLELAMMIETQALDLYLRMAGECRVDSASTVLLRIAEEEKAHLAMLARFLEAKAG
jgi:sulfur-carrier protein adenylyltransferase/sulfurtransferase